MKHPSEYPVTIRPISPVEGGGFAALVRDLPGCMSDGETPREAYENAQDAIQCWMEAATEMGRPVPEPTPDAPEKLIKYG